MNLFCDRSDKLQLDFSGRYPMLSIPAELEKGNRGRVLPIAPEFAEFLDQTPEVNRRGRLFRPMGCRSDRLISGRVCRNISRIGKAAGIKASEKRGNVMYTISAGRSDSDGPAA